MLKSAFKNTTVVTILRWTACLTLLARAYQFIVFDPGFMGAYLWNDDLVMPFLKLMGKEWNDLVTSLAVERYYLIFKYIYGGFFAFTAFLALFIKPKQTKLGWLLPIASLLLLPYFFKLFGGDFKANTYVIEHIAQFSAPVLLWLTLFKNLSVKRLNIAVQIIAAITFTAHGFFAAGVVRVPASFIGMVMRGLSFPAYGINITQEGAKVWLFWFGIADFIVSGIIVTRLLLLSLKFNISKSTKSFLWRCATFSLAYMVLWGFVTALARPYTNFISYDWGRSLVRWTYEFFVRTSHFSLPLLAFYIETKVLPNRK